MSKTPLLALFFASAALAVPTGMSPYIAGIHDVPSGDLLVDDGSGSCRKGWITELRYIGHAGHCTGALDYSALAEQGYGIILRLDDSGAPALPPREADWDAFAETFADCVASSSGVRVFVVGNEPNIDWGHPEGRTFTPVEVAEIYRRVVDAVDARGLLDEVEILFPAMAPWSSVQPWGDWDLGLEASLDHLLNTGGVVDGVSIHAYTRVHTPGAVTSDEWFPGREGRWRLHFRGYRDSMRILAERGLVDLPLYLTETGSACDPPCDPYPNGNNGYFVAMANEVHQWNQANPSQLIRAFTPYRWTLNDDGSGRDFCVGCDPGLRDDLRNAANLDHTWSGTGCHSPLPEPEPVDPIGVMQGVVFDKTTGGAAEATRLPHATIRCDCASCACAEPTPVDEVAYFRLALPPGAYTLIAEAEGYLPGERAVTVVNGVDGWGSVGIEPAPTEPDPEGPTPEEPTPEPTPEEPTPEPEAARPDEPTPETPGPAPAPRGCGQAPASAPLVILVALALVRRRNNG